MKPWESALNKFLEKWKNKTYVEGAILTGSHVTNHQSKYSDLDIYIILSPKVKWRERGNERVEGYLMEYFANPPQQIKSYFKEDFKDRRNITATMFVTSRILFDKTGIVNKLRKEASRYVNKKFKKMDKVQIEISKYIVWDDLDNLKDIYDQKAQNFNLVYYSALKRILDTYSSFLQIEIPSQQKILKYLENKEFRERYGFRELTDRTFSALFVKCLEEKDEKQKMKTIEKISGHVLNKMGGFNIDKWKIRSKLKISK